MEDLEMQKGIIQLGKTIVNEFQLDPGVDTLARWMSHYIAEQIVLSEKSEMDKREKSKEKCFEMILQLWNHRSDFPNRIRPFKDFDSILNVLSSINPENNTMFYYNQESIDEKKEPSEVQYWLEIAKEIDKVARIWLDFSIKKAASIATNEKTIELLKNINIFHEGKDTLLYKLLLEESYLEKEFEDLREYNNVEIQEKIKTLEYFTELNKEILEHYNKIINK